MTDGIISNINLDLDGSPSDVGTTLAKLLAVLDEHPDPFEINVCITRPARTITVTPQMRTTSEVNAILIRDVLKPSNGTESATKRRLMDVFDAMHIHTIGDLRARSVQELLRFDGFGPATVKFLTDQLARHQGVELKEK